MTDRERQEYKLALKEGKKQFGSECKHKRVKNGYCINCWRRVIIGRLTHRSRKEEVER